MSKISAVLGQVVHALENDYTSYDWASQGSCNCGHVAQVILNQNCKEIKKSFTTEVNKFFTRKEKITIKEEKGFFFDKKVEVKEMILEEDQTWKNLVKMSCSATGLSGSSIIQAFYEAGFRAEDIVHIEYLQNKAILSEANIDFKSDSQYYMKKNNLILYLKAWMRILAKTDSTNKVSKRNELEKSLLRAVDEENYEEALSIKNEISILV